MNPQRAWKEVVVRPANVRRETVGLLAALLLIAAGMGLRFWMNEAGAATRFLRPYQRLDNLLIGSERTVYQALLAAVPEIVDLRDEEGQWPEAELLQMESVPPFDDSLLPPGLRSYAWEGHDGMTWMDYLGNTSDPKLTYSFILRVIDLHADYHPHPHPGLDYDPNMRVATQVWVYPQRDRPYPGERLPEAGWWWVVGPDDPTLRAPADDRATARVAEQRERQAKGNKP